MKKLIFAFVLLLSFSSFSQEAKIEKKSNEPEFKSDLIKINTEQNTLEFTGNVSFKTEIIELENAEKIVYNQSTKELIVTGLNDFTIDGAIQIKDKASKKILRYKIGEKIAYLE
jgi:lipopolysaccharide assembly outer membrane protein LptD (OstA)